MMILTQLGLALIAMATAGRARPSAPEFGRFSPMPASALAGVLLFVTVGALDEETG